MNGERPWEEGAAPTPEQWAAWFVSLDEEARVKVAELAIDAMDRASRCWILDHEQMVEEMRPWSQLMRRILSGDPGEYVALRRYSQDVLLTLDGSWPVSEEEVAHLEKMVEVVDCRRDAPND